MLLSQIRRTTLSGGVTPFAADSRTTTAEGGGIRRCSGSTKGTGFLAAGSEGRGRRRSIRPRGLLRAAFIHFFFFFFFFSLSAYRTLSCLSAPLPRDSPLSLINTRPES